MTIPANITGAFIVNYKDMTEAQLLDLLDEYRHCKPSECELIVAELRERRKNDKKNCSKRATKTY